MTRIGRFRILEFARNLKKSKTEINSQEPETISFLRDAELLVKSRTCVQVSCTPGLAITHFFGARVDTFTFERCGIFEAQSQMA